MPKLSVIVPVYNVEEYLNRCVDSILNQTFKDFELILVDDGSPDHCPEICDDYASKYSFVHVIHKENGGLSDARNAGIEWAFANSESEWIAFVDSDDWIDKRCFEFAYEIVNKFNLKICAYRAIEVCEKAQSCEEIKLDFIIDNPEELFLKNLLNIMSSCMGIYEKQLFRNKRFPYGKLHEDGFVIPSVLYSCDKIGFINNALYYYFINPKSITHGEKTVKWVDDQLEGIMIQIDFFSTTKFERTFNARIKRFKLLVSQYFEDYGKNGVYKKALVNRVSQVKRIIYKNRRKVTCFDTNYSFNKWVIGVPEKMKVLKNDIRTVKDEKGAFYACLWATVNYIKIKLFMRI